MPNIKEKNLVYFNPRIPFNSGSCTGLNLPLSSNAYLLFRKHNYPSIPKPFIIVKRNEAGERLDDGESTYLTINAAGFIDETTLNSPFVEGYFLYPFDNEGNPELYDIYVVSKKNLNNFQETQLDNYIPTQGLNNYLYVFVGMPSAEYLLNNLSLEDDRISNLVKDGQFTNTYIDLPANNEFKEGEIRSPITQVNDNMTYEVALNQNYTSALFDDTLSVVPFVGDPGLEAAPKNYFRIQAKNSNPALPWTYRDIAFYFEPYYKFNDRPFVLSFCAINNDLDLTPLLPISVGYERNYGPNTVIEPRTTFADIEPFQVTNLWQKFFTEIDLASNPDYVQMGNPTYVKILLRLPTTLNAFDLSITNIYLDYGSEEVYYPIDYEQTYPNTVDNYGKPIINTSNGYIPMSSRAGEIKQFITANDTETTILADGRVIYSNDVHYYNMNGVLFQIPYSNSYKTGLYDLIGYKYGTGNDHFTCDSLYNDAWTSDTQLFSNIFYWNYSSFNPTADFTTGLGDGTKIKAVELHRGQDIPIPLEINTAFQKDNSNEIWYSIDEKNYLNQAIANGLNSAVFYPSNSIGYQVNATGNIINNIQYDQEGIFPLDNPDSDANALFIKTSKLCGPISTNPYNGNDNNTFPIKKIDRTLVGGSWGNIDVTKVDITESPVYITNSDFYVATTPNLSNSPRIDGLTIIAKMGPELKDITPGLTYLNQSSSFTYSAVKLVSNNDAFPLTSPTFNVEPLPPIPPQSAFVLKTTVIPTYYQDPAYNWFVAEGTGNTLKKIMPFLANQGRRGFGIQLISTTLADYYGLWFFAQSNATREVTTASYVNNIPTINTTVVDDNKFCFYFSNGATPQPVNPAIPGGTTFIPIVITSATGTGDEIKEKISILIEKAVNSYRVQIPDLRGMVLQGYGNSIFQNFQNNDNPELTMCKNLRNQDTGRPKMIEYQKTFTYAGVYYSGGGSLKKAISGDIIERTINANDTFYIYNHISVS